MPKELPSPDLLRKLLRYEPSTGRLFWLKRPEYMFKATSHAGRWNGRFAGQEAFTAVECNGYCVGKILGGSYRAHRVIWVLVTGAWPADQIDHINGVKTDNRFLNLREVDSAGNRKNMPMGSSNTSGVVGVCFIKERDKWRATIKVAGKTIYLGTFMDFEYAVAARKSAEAEYGFHKNHGRLKQ